MGAPAVSSHHALLTEAAEQIHFMRDRLEKNQSAMTAIRRIDGSMDLTMAMEHLRDAELRLREAAGEPPR